MLLYVVEIPNQVVSCNSVVLVVINPLSNPRLMDDRQKFGLGKDGLLSSFSTSKWIDVEKS